MMEFKARNFKKEQELLDKFAKTIRPEEVEIVWDITDKRPAAKDTARALVAASHSHVENSPDRAAWMLCRALAEGYEPLLATEVSPSEGKRNLVISGYPDDKMAYAQWKSTDANAFVSLRHAIHNAMSGKGSLERVMEYVAQKRDALKRFGSC